MVLYEAVRKVQPSGSTATTAIATPNVTPTICSTCTYKTFRLAVWQYRLWSFQSRGTKFERLLPKNQYTQWKLLNFEFWINGQLSKIWNHFSNKVFKKLFYQKMSLTKNVLLNWYSSMKKKRKIWMIFDIENWLWKSNFGTFWQLAINPKLKIH